jgi:K+-transporting ATPase ATPase C chain
LAVLFFTNYSADLPGTFPGVVPQKGADGENTRRIEPVRVGNEIQVNFFEMWLQDHPGADLQLVPADMVMASGSGLDPHITLSNALWQLDRVAAAWSSKTGIEPRQVRSQIEQLLREQSHAPMGGLFGVPLVNVLEVNLALRERYSVRGRAARRH